MKNNLSRTAAAFSALTFITAFACKKPQIVEAGKEVKVNYTLTVEEKVVDSSVGKTPLSYVAGSGMILPSLDQQLTGMKVGEKKHVTLTPEKGYGVLNPKAVQKIPIAAFGDTKGLKPGMIVTGNNQGHPIQARVMEISKQDITLDMNHPLAGKTLDFDIEIVEIGIPTAVPPAAMPAAAPAEMPASTEKKPS